MEILSIRQAARCCCCCWWLISRALSPRDCVCSALDPTPQHPSTPPGPAWPVERGEKGGPRRMSDYVSLVGLVSLRLVVSPGPGRTGASCQPVCAGPGGDRGLFPLHCPPGLVTLHPPWLQALGKDRLPFSWAGGGRVSEWLCAARTDHVPGVPLPCAQVTQQVMSGPLGTAGAVGRHSGPVSLQLARRRFSRPLRALSHRLSVLLRREPAERRSFSPPPLPDHVGVTSNLDGWGAGEKPGFK